MSFNRFGAVAGLALVAALLASPFVARAGEATEQLRATIHDSLSSAAHGCGLQAHGCLSAQFGICSFRLFRDGAPLAGFALGRVKRRRAG
jgi:hypothetical protein